MREPFLQGLLVGLAVVAFFYVFVLAAVHLAERLT